MNASTVSRRLCRWRPAEPTLVARRWMIQGRVQGVGFRPFVYRLALEHGLHGWVSNDLGGVVVVAQGACAALDAFGRDLTIRAPKLARVGSVEVQSITAPGTVDFRIRVSESTGSGKVQIAPDQSVCAACLEELRDPAARRFGYPFTNCTQCGPRYTIMRSLPYDRHSTSMAAFIMCADCKREYCDPGDRRFHAQPLACPACGPKLWWRNGSPALFERDTALRTCIETLRGGAIVAVCGVGGYHLMCDAANVGAVQRLRARKQRPDKPLALMLPLRGEDGLDWARTLGIPDDAEATALLDASRPIVLVRRRSGAPVAADVARGAPELGLMLPYSPLHHLLLEGFGGPLVATSANASGEPVLIDPQDVEARLVDIADGYLHHDRPIVRSADDPVVRAIAGRVRPLRLGRGTAPLELRLARPLPRPLLALGAFSKITVALAWEDRVVVSPHIGSLGTPRARRRLFQVAEDLQRLYGVTAERIACDAHPDYPTHRWARGCGLPVSAVLHHHAHASAVAGEFGIAAPMLCFTWDGTGFGAGGALWGGEALWGSPGAWLRVGSWRPFTLPGGERAVAQPWRTALGLCWHTGHEWSGAPEGLDPLLRRAYGAGLGMQATSAVGRLFDAAAALLGLVDSTSYEAQAPMRLEALAGDRAASAVCLPLAEDAAGVLCSDWAPLVDVLLDHRRAAADRAAVFHESLSRSLVQQAVAIHERRPFTQVGLAGGVFQNRRLCAAACSALRQRGFEVLIPERLPMNDAGISFGQIIDAAARELGA